VKKLQAVSDIASGVQFELGVLFQAASDKNFTAVRKAAKQITKLVNPIVDSSLQLKFVSTPQGIAASDVVVDDLSSIGGDMSSVLQTSKAALIESVAEKDFQLIGDVFFAIITLAVEVGNGGDCQPNPQ